MIEPHERIDDLFREEMKIIQSKEVFSFSVDALLLANFVTLRKQGAIIDLCSGNGIIPLLLSHRTDLMIDAIEIQTRLVDMAERSIKMNDKTAQINLIEGDINNIAKYYPHSSFDVITVNPPYFTENQPLKQRNAHAYARHEILTTLEQVVAACRYLIKNKGRLYMVHRAERSTEVIAILQNNNFRVSHIQYVYNARDSNEALFVLIEAVFHSKAYVKVLPPFYIYNIDGEYSKEMLEVYYG